MRSVVSLPCMIVLLTASVLSLLLTSGSVAAGAEEMRLGGLLSTQDSSDAAPSMVLLMDSSGSMRDPDGSGEPKIDAARTAVTTAVAALDPSEQVGFRVFGATVLGGENNPAACTDSQLVVPIAADNRAALSSAVDDYEPKGDTPIGFALQEAAGDLGDQGNRTIVLVSDGLATCDLDPCEVAEDLAGKGIDLTIHVVGLDVDVQAREQLRCVATAGRGVYFDADDAESLTAAMDRLSTRAYRPFTVQGDAVEGTSGASSAPELKPGGQYTDSLANQGSVKHYAISRTQPGTSVHVGVSALPGFDSTGQVRVGLETLAGDECGWDYAQTSHDLTTSDVYALLSAQVSAYPTPDRKTDPCGQETSLLVVVEMTDWEAEISGTPYEIVVAEEPPVADGQTLPKAPKDTTWEEMRIGAAKPIDAGTSCNDAPILEPGQTYESELLSGETTFFRVPVDFGQRVQAQVDFPAPDPALSQQFEDSLVSSKLDLFSPHRGDVGETFVDGTELNDFELMSRDNRTAFGVTSADVVWLNRDILALDRKNASTPGDYYVAVSLSRDEDGDSSLVPFTLTVDAPGEAGAGAPEYAAAVEPVTEPDDSTSDGAEATSSTDSSAQEPSEPVDPQAQVDPPAAAANSGSTPIWLWSALAALGVVVIAVGVVGLRRTMSGSESS